MPTRLDRKTIERTAFVTAGVWMLFTFLLPHLLWGQDIVRSKRGW